MQFLSGVVPPHISEMKDLLILHLLLSGTSKKKKKQKKKGKQTEPTVTLQGHNLERGQGHL